MIAGSVAPRLPLPGLALLEHAARLGWSVSAPFRRSGGFVFTYHRVRSPDDPFPHVDVADFRRHLEWFGRHFEVIEPAKVREAAERAPGRRPPALLTFDDGYRCVHDLVAPLLREYGFPAVTFVITDYADRPRLLPWDRLFLAVARGRARRVAPPWAPDRLVAIDGPRRHEFLAACRDHFRHLSPDDRARVTEDLVAALNPPDSQVDRQTMTWDEIRAVGDIVTAGGHTHTHPYLSTMDAAAVDDEIRICRARLIAETGVQPTLFAYPHGDVAAAARPALMRYGLDVAFSTVAGVNGTGTDWLAARRLGVGSMVPTRWMTTQSWTLAHR
jgi:peptidoglycan/xylan/chitin deacetylase (PgdA/CDA1 family)